MKKKIAVQHLLFLTILFLPVVYFLTSCFPAAAEAQEGEGVPASASPLAGLSISAQQGVADTQLEAGGGSISGTLTDGATGIPGIYVYLYNGAGTWVSPAAITLANGTYSFTNLSTDTYTLYFYGVSVNYVNEWYDDKTQKIDATPIPLTAPATITGIDAVLASGSSISGIVTDSCKGAAVANAWINAYNTNGIWLGGTKTASNGSYTLTGLPFPGDCKIQFFEATVLNAGSGLSQWYNKKSDIASATPVPAGSTGINASLDGAKIAGTILNQKGEGVEGVTVGVYRNNGNLTVISGPTSSDGKYEICGLRTGNYTIKFNAGNTIYTGEWYNNKISKVNSDLLTVTAPNTSLIDVKLELDKPLVPVYKILLLK